MSDFETRFGGIARLYGRDGLEKLRAAHVCVVGIGGVGTWAAEALARSGVGALTLVDLDEVCVTNLNRQLHALTETVGRAKVEVMAERIRAINPECRVEVEQKFFNAQTAEELLAPQQRAVGVPPTDLISDSSSRKLPEARYDYILDAIDSVTNKVLLLAKCREKKIPVVSCGGAGGRRDATQIRVADWAKVSHDRLLAEVRKKLRKEFHFPTDGSPMNIDCVFSAEPPVFAQSDGSVCATRAESEDGTRLNCNGGLGSATFVTGTFGFAAAGIVVRKIAGN